MTTLELNTKEDLDNFFEQYPPILDKNENDQLMLSFTNPEDLKVVISKEAEEILCRSGYANILAVKTGVRQMGESIHHMHKIVNRIPFYKRIFRKGKE